jgi:hypothetical protein
VTGLIVARDQDVMQCAEASPHNKNFGGVCVYVCVCVYERDRLGYELRALCFAKQVLYQCSPVHFALIILEMGPQELFAPAGL